MNFLNRTMVSLLTHRLLFTASVIVVFAFSVRLNCATTAERIDAIQKQHSTHHNEARGFGYWMWNRRMGRNSLQQYTNKRRIRRSSKAEIVSWRTVLRQRQMAAKSNLRWVDGPWSQCSSSCGNGVQTRTVHCKDVYGYIVSNGCENFTKPAERRKCISDPCFNLQSDNEEMAMQRPQSDDVSWIRQLMRPSSSVSTEPSFVVGEWEECSVTCGHGIRKRTVECKILLEFSRTVAKLPDSHCPGVKPKEIDSCSISCSDNKFRANVYQNDTSIKSNFGSNLPKSLESAALALSSSKLESGFTYSWRSSGFSQCTATCLGGTQESIIQCVQDKDLEVVSTYLCDLNEKPDSITRTCNDHPCPPRWNVSQYTPCSKSCGGGLQIREINCIHEIARGAANTVVVPNEKCPLPVPRSEQSCNVFDCPMRWKAEQWSKCPKSCGGGMKTRKLKCIKEMAFGQIQELSPSRCPRKKPRTMKICNRKACVNLGTNQKGISNVVSSNDHVYIQNEPLRRVSVIIGGKAVVIKGTNLKIRCPRRGGSNKTAYSVNWFKDDLRLKPDKKHLVNTRGALRIKSINYSDAGIYTCASGKSRKSINIVVKPPVNRFSSEEAANEVDARDVNIHTFSRNSVQERSENSSQTQHVPHNMIKNETLVTSNVEEVTVDNYPDDNRSKAPVLISDQRTESSEVNYEVFMSSSTKDPFSNGEGMARSSAMSHQPPIHQLQQLLSNLRHTFQSSNISPQAMTNGLISEQPLITETTTENSPKLIGESVVLGKGNPEDLKFDWLLSDWSSCSQSCGGIGFQVRARQCLVRFNNITKRVDESLCLDVGLETPLTLKECGVVECPQWRIGSWSPCSNCQRLGIGIQSRKVACLSSTGEQYEVKYCNESLKPKIRKECKKADCKPMWVAGDWSQCYGRCGGEGLQSRSLHCLWYETDKPAGNSCSEMSRPSAKRSCHKSCNSETCIDKSTHCSLAKTFHLCRFTHYRRQCCNSCNDDLLE